MPRGTKVHNCVQDFKRKGKKGNAYAICQAATGQKYHDGSSIEGFRKKQVKSGGK